MSHVIRALLARSEWNPGTVMIPQYQFDKTKQHTHKWTGHKKCPVRMNHVTLMNVWRHIQMSYVPHANMLFQIIDWLMLPLSIHEKWFSSFAGTWSSITMKSVSNECIFFMCGGVAAVLAEGRTQKGTMIFKGYNDCKRVFAICGPGPHGPNTLRWYERLREPNSTKVVPICDQLSYQSLPVHTWHFLHKTTLPNSSG